MYRQFRLRFRNLPLPVSQFTREHPDVRVIAFPVAREGKSPLPTENLYLVRAPKPRHDAVTKLFEGRFRDHERIDTMEPNLLIYRGRFRMPDDEDLRGFIGVLGEALGTVLQYDPITIEGGVLDVPVLALPLGESTLRLRALQGYGAEHGIEFQLAGDTPVPTLPVERPRQGILDLLEWQVLQALDAAGLYQEDPASEAAAHEALQDLADEFGLTTEEAQALRTAAERKVVREYARTRSRNLGLSTPPQRDE